MNARTPGTTRRQRQSLLEWFPGRVRPRLLVESGAGHRTRRARDVIYLVGAIVGLAILSVTALPPGGFERELAVVVRAIPRALSGLWSFLVEMAMWWAAVLVVAILVRGRWSLLRDVVLAVVAAVGMVLLVARIVEGTLEFTWGAPMPGDPSMWAPWLRVVLPLAVLTTASPFLTKPFRTFGLWLMILSVFGAFLLSLAPSSVVAGALVAVAASSTIHLVFGSTMGWPDIDDVAAGLAALQVQARGLEVVDRQRAGFYRLVAYQPDGTPLDIKVYGRDASDTQFLSTVWRRLFYRGLEDRFIAGRLHQVEHEAYLTLMAAQGGLPTQRVVMGGQSPNGDAILVLAGPDDAAEAPEWDGDLVRGMWAGIEKLHAAGMAHNQIERSKVVATPNGVGLTDFRLANASPEPWRLSVDRVQALVTSAIELGPQRAIGIAEEMLGAEALAALLPLLQADMVVGDSRRALRAGALDIDHLRGATATKLGIKPPELQRLRRVSVASVLRTLLPILAFYVLLSALADLDFAALADTLAGAVWWLVAIGFVVAQVPRFGQALSAIGAAPVPLPLGRVYTLQLAQGFIALTLPTAAARIAMNVRFLQRHGLPPGTALAAGAVDQFTGFFVQLVLLAVVVLFGSFTFQFDPDTDVSSGLLQVLLIVAIAAVVSVLVFLAWPRIRKPTIERVKRYASDARMAFRGLGSPRRLAFLLGGNFTTEFLSAVALAVFVLALGHPISLWEAVTIYIIVSLLAGILPVPGGVGVFEGGLILGLTGVGVPEAAAFTAAILFRASTYYLPPLWGYVAFRWLERNKHV